MYARLRTAAGRKRASVFGVGGRFGRKRAKKAGGGGRKRRCEGTGETEGGEGFSIASEFFSRLRERSFVGGRVGGPANNAGLVFLNPRTNRHLRGEMPGHSARCSSRCSAHLSLFLLLFGPGEARHAAPRRGRRKRSHGPWLARAPSLHRSRHSRDRSRTLDPRRMNYRAFQSVERRGDDRPEEKTPRDRGPVILPTLLFGKPGIRRGNLGPATAIRTPLRTTLRILLLRTAQLRVVAFNPIGLANDRDRNFDSTVRDVVCGIDAWKSSPRQGPWRTRPRWRGPDGP